jgi:hypothetical protein
MPFYSPSRSLARHRSHLPPRSRQRTSMVRRPLAHNWAEGQKIVDAVNRYGRIWQTGSWQRSTLPFRVASELGSQRPHRQSDKVEIGLPAGSPRLGWPEDTKWNRSNLPKLSTGTLASAPAPYVPYAPCPRAQDVALELRYPAADR